MMLTLVAVTLTLLWTALVAAAVALIVWWRQAGDWERGFSEGYRVGFVTAMSKLNVTSISPVDSPSTAAKPAAGFTGNTPLERAAERISSGAVRGK